MDIFIMKGFARHRAILTGGNGGKHILPLLFVFLLLLVSPSYAQKLHRLSDDAQIRAQSIKYSSNRILASGNVHVFHKGAVLKADKIEYDETAKIIKADGNVRMMEGEDTIYGDSLLYNAGLERATLWNARGSTGRMEMEGKKMTGRLFFWSRKMVREKGFIRLEKGIFTTCDVPKPEYHYHFTAREALIYPNEKLVARHVGVHIHQKLLLNRPLLIMSLKKEDKRQNYIPSVGYSTMEGLSLRESLFIAPRKDDSGRVNIDYYEKTGIGGGLDYNYALGPNGRGNLHWYQLSPNATALMRNDLSAVSTNNSIGKNEFSNYLNYSLPGNLNFGLGYSSYKYAYPQTGSTEWQSNSFYISKGADRYNYSLSQGITNYQNLNYINRSFDYGYRFNDNLKVHVGTYGNTQESSSFSSRSMWQYYGDIFSQGEYLDTILSAKKTCGSSVFFMDKLPEITFRSKKLSLSDVPLNASLSMGDYYEMPTNVKMGRANLQVSTKDLSWPIGDNGHFDVEGGVRQLFYDNKGAKYIATGGASLNQDYGFFGTRLNYFVQRTDGYTPFLSDYAGKYNLLTGGFELHPGKKWNIGLFSGYDFDSNNFHSLVGRVAFEPWKNTRFDFGTNYNLQKNYMVNINSQISLDLGNGLSLNHWTLYDTVNSKYTYQDFSLSKENHDYLTRVVYRSEQQEFWFQFALKTFPQESVSVGSDPQRIIMPQKRW